MAKDMAFDLMERLDERLDRVSEGTARESRLAFCGEDEAEPGWLCRFIVGSGMVQSWLEKQILVSPLTDTVGERLDQGSGAEMREMSGV